MKKTVLICVFTFVIILAVLFLPVPVETVGEGVTREYAALAYRIVDWNRLTEDGVYDKTCFYFLTDRDKSIDELWEMEEAKLEQSFLATVIELNDTLAVVEPLENESESHSSDRISFNISELDKIGAQVGSIVEVSYTGGIRESYPAAIDATGWRISTNNPDLEYTGEWLDKETADKYDTNIFSDIVITEIYSNCFFARTVIPMPYEIKLNGSLPADWCVGDQVTVTYENVYYDEDNQRVEVDFLDVEVSSFEIDDMVCYKPVIYLYPEETTEVSVKLKLDGGLTCTYPSYRNGWLVTASLDGTLTDAEGQTYNYLYWEGKTNVRYDLSKGFCVKGEDTAAFLEEALAKLGLTRVEANEFIVYWLPLMQDNPYNIISFQTDAYTDAAKLEISPLPDTLIRVFMAWQAVDFLVSLDEQILTAPNRTGFTVIEWGGTEIP